jgi:hypothetical protein
VKGMGTSLGRTRALSIVLLIALAGPAGAVAAKGKPPAPGKPAKPSAAAQKGAQPAANVVVKCSAVPTKAPAKKAKAGKRAKKQKTFACKAQVKRTLTSVVCNTESSTVTNPTDFCFDAPVPAALVAHCVEPVEVSGELHMLMTVSQTPSGNWSMKTGINFQGVKGRGALTAAQYTSSNSVEVTTTHSNATDTQTAVANFTFVAQGALSDIRMKTTLHLTVANGVPTAVVANMHADTCD